jgi:hypothetical protein
MADDLIEPGPPVVHQPVHQPPGRPQALTPIFVPASFNELSRFAELAAASDLVPKDYKDRPGNIMIACQMGSELGLTPMQSLNSIAVINGRPGVWGDGLIALCRRSKLCEDITERFEGEGESRVAICIAKRRGASPIEARFSVADAKKAGLWQTQEKVRRKDRQGNFYDAVNDSPWFRYPDRMLKARARGFALRDAFPDLLRGLRTAEELWDTPPDQDDYHRGPTIEAGAEAVHQPVHQAPVHRPVHQPQPAPDGSPPRMTNAQFLAALNAELDAAPDADAVQAMLRSERVARALGALKGDAARMLDEWVARAKSRHDELTIAEHARQEQEQPPDAKPPETATEPDAGALNGPLPDDISAWPLAGEENLQA